MCRPPFPGRIFGAGDRRRNPPALRREAHVGASRIVDPSHRTPTLMSLIGFHKVLITTGILFSGGFGVWQIVRFAGGGGWPELLLAAAFVAGAASLAVYLAHLDRFVGRPER